MDAFDVGVIGAGIHGAAAAYHLAGRGASVAVLERAVPAGGPTGRSSAICRAYYTNPFLAACARDSIAMFRDFRELTGRDAGFRRTGLLFLHPPEDAPEMRRAVERLNALGIATDLLEPGAIAERFPAFDLEGIGIAGFEREAGYADPDAATLGLFERAVALGAEARLGRRIIRLDQQAGGGAVLEADDGSRAACGRVLIAAGPWTRPLALQAGADLPLHVERHFVAVFRWGDADPVQAHGDLVGGYYFRPEGEELYLVGPLPAEPQADPDAYPEEIADHEVARMAELVVKRVPHLEASETARGWASLYDVSPDWQPVIGEIAPGVFVDAGTSGHGFKLAPALGAHVAAMVLGEEADPGLAAFDPFRFEDGRTLRAGYGDARILG
ncbi:MAG TPA: FAD-binding oxidoreductase [Actinomycetota bacterium]|jgi:glycine/D-amino acid oxidase-like deaminating enzyme|nr:FAD-binding oxidoreductase [Actinomycetota bacterium]